MGGGGGGLPFWILAVDVTLLVHSSGDWPIHDRGQVEGLVYNKGQGEGHVFNKGQVEGLVYDKGLVESFVYGRKGGKSCV